MTKQKEHLDFTFKSFEQCVRRLEAEDQAMVCVNKNHSIVYANDSACRYFGLNKSKLLAISLKDISATAQQIIFNNEIRDVDSEIFRFIANNEKHKISYAGKLKIAPVKIGKRLLNIVSFTQTSEDEIHHEEDDVEIKHLKLHSKENKHYYIDALDLPVGCTVFFDTDMRYTDVIQSPEWQDNTKRLKGRKLQDIIPAHKVKFYENYYKAALRGEKNVFDSVELSNNKTYRNTIAPVYDEDANIVGGVIFSQIIQQLKDTEEQLKQKIYELENSQMRYRSIARNIPNGMILLYDCSYNLLVAEGSAIQYFVKDKNVHSENKNMFDVFQEPVYNKLKPYFELSLAGQQLAFEIQSEDGRWFQCICCKLSDYNNKAQGMAVFLDIDKLKRVEEELNLHISDLRKSEHLYRSLIENVPNGALIMFNKDFVYTVVEGKGLLGMGYKKEDMLGKSLYEVFPPELSNIMAPKYAATLNGMSDTFEMKGIYGGNTYLVSLIPVVNAAGKIDQGLAVAFDIDKLKNTEKELELNIKALEKNKSIYKMLAGSIPNASLLLINREYRLTVVEGEALAMAGYVNTDLEGKTLKEVFKNRPEAYEYFDVFLQRVFKGESLKFDGKSKTTGNWFSLSAFPFSNENGKIVDVMMVVFDIQDQKNAEEEIAIQLKELENINQKYQQEIEYRKSIEEDLQAYTEELKMKNAELEQFAYVASHDLQEPLRMISSFSQLLAKKLSNKLDADAKEYLNFTMEGAQRMQRLISELLTYSRMGRNYKYDPISFEEIINEVKTNLSLLITESKANIEVNQFPQFTADKIQLVQLFQNLISNALKFKKPDTVPSIKITCEELPDCYEFSLSDNGIGFSMEHKDRIFNIFQRLHTQDKYEGTGIGLALCKKIIEKHHGEIWVESNIGEGSTFYFTISKKLSTNVELN